MYAGIFQIFFFPLSQKKDKNTPPKLPTEVVEHQEILVKFVLFFLTGYLAEAFYSWINKHMHHRKISSTKAVTLSALELELEVLLRKKLHKLPKKQIRGKTS